MPPPDRDFWCFDMSAQKLSARRAGEVQCLGKMPQSDRVSALDPAQSATMQVSATVRPGIWDVRHVSPKPFGPRVGEVQCLGDVP
jgi:hypothetical protein